MQQIITFLENNIEIVLSSFSTIIYIIFSIILFCKTKDIKYLKEVRNKMDKKITYRGEFYQQETKPVDGTTFRNVFPVYRLNKATNELEENGSIDIVEFVNSFKDQTLLNILDKFMPETDEEKLVLQVNNYQDGLDKMMDTFNLANDYRSKFNLPADMGIDQVFAYVEKQSKDLKTKLEDLQKQKESAKENEENA